VKSVAGIAIRSIAAAVPTSEVLTADYQFLTTEERARLQKAVGIRARRIASIAQCASDLCAAAATRVIGHLGWARDSIGAVVLITQTADQPLPATAIVLQHKLGLPPDCIAFDVNLGCSGYPFGLAILGSLMRTLGIPRALLLMGDVSSRLCSIDDKSTWPLFGDAGSATALELNNAAPEMRFDLMSDGSGKDAIIVPGGGLASRIPPTTGLVTEGVGADGILRRPDSLTLRGADVFSFAISKIPSSIERVMQAEGSRPDDVDFLVLHQANKMINDTIAKKTGFPAAKNLSTLDAFGNTSSASIPLTICAHNGLFESTRLAAVSGFGVGLSWGSTLLRLEAGVALPIVESDDVY